MPRFTLGLNPAPTLSPPRRVAGSPDRRATGRPAGGPAGTIQRFSNLFIYTYTDGRALFRGSLQKPNLSYLIEN